VFEELQTFIWTDVERTSVSGFKFTKCFDL
jgi:hypothetical protein